jgi:cysteine desulfurase
MERYYFDANATAPPLPKVVEVVRRTLLETWANPTSTHREGQRARHLLEEARRTVAADLGVPPGQLIFCASATEALHLLVRGLHPALGAKATVVFPGEHSACLNPLRDWADVRWLPCDPAGAATVVQMAANNETGLLYIMPKVPSAVRLMDAAQAWGKVPLDLSSCDAAVFSGHKIGGPRGVAVLWMRNGLPWTTVMEGPQERRRRGGTEDLPAILGLEEAVKALPERLEANRALGPLRDILEDEVLSWSADFEAVGRGRPRLPNTSALLLRGHRGEAVQIALDLAGFAVSTGSACHSGATKPSHAITSLGYSEDEARSVLRVSLLPGTTSSAVEALLAALKKMLRVS